MTIAEYEGPYKSYYYWKNHGNRKDNMDRFQLDYLPTDKVILWGFRVFEEFQGKGYSYKMLSEVIKLAKKRSDKPLVLYVYADNEIAINVYKKAGFEITGTYDRAPYGDAWEMTYMPSKAAA